MKNTKQLLFVNDIKTLLRSVLFLAVGIFFGSVVYAVPKGQTETINYKPDGLFKIKKDGSWLYKTKKSPQRFAGSLRIGSISSPILANTSTGTPINFSEIYPDSNGIAFLFDIEWHLLKFFGQVGLKVGSGFFTTSGNGVFVNPPQGSRQANPPRELQTNEGNTRAQEIFTFYMFPNNVSIVYRGKWWSKQPIIPFAETGVDYYGFLETRDDLTSPSLGGSLSNTLCWRYYISLRLA